MQNITISTDLSYIFLFFMVLLIPKVLLRFRIPVGISCLFLGVITSMTLGWYQNDQIIILLSRLGITSLFLFAGLEIEIEELKKDWKTLAKYLGKSLSVLFASAYVLGIFFNLDFRVSLILAIGIFTPSTGFILNSLKNYQFTVEQQYWIRSKAISKEIAAILILFFALQSQSIQGLIVSKLVLIFLVIALPIIFKFFLKSIAPYAPDSEMSFLIIMALVCGVITKEIGTYYLVGAFIVGLVASQFRHFMDSEKSHSLLNSVTAFFSIFIPFYFFNAGLSFTNDFLTLKGLAIGILFSLVFIPIRLFLVISSIRFFLKDFWGHKRQISISLLPNLIFGLVIATILKDRFSIDPDIISGLVVYTVVTSIIPSIVFKKANPSTYDFRKVGQNR